MKFQGIDIGAVKQKGISIGEVRQKGILIWPNDYVYNLTAVYNTDGSVSLNWDDIPNADFYRLEIRVEGWFDWTEQNINGSSNIIQSEITSDGYLTGETFEFRVRASINGSFVNYSNIVSVTVSEPAYITLDPTSYDTNSAASTFSIAVDSNIAWAATSENAFLTITSGASGNGSGTIEVSVAEHTAENVRTGNIRVEGGGVIKYVGVNQTGVAVSPYDPSTVTFMETQNIPQDNNPSQYSGLTNNDVWVLFDSVVAYGKSQGVWNQIYHWHPMAGAGVIERGYNAIDVNSFYMNFEGGWVFTPMGNVGNGFNTYAHWGFVPQTQMAFEDSGMSIVSTEGGSNAGFDYGSLTDNNRNARMAISYNGKFYVYLGDAKNVNNSIRTGCFTMVRDNGTVKAFRSGIEILSTAGGGVGLSLSQSIYGAINQGSSEISAVVFGDKTYADAMHHTSDNPAAIQEMLRMWNEGLGRL